MPKTSQDAEQTASVRPTDQGFRVSAQSVTVFCQGQAGSVEDHSNRLKLETQRC